MPESKHVLRLFCYNKNDMFRIYPQAETYYTEQQKTGEN